MLNIKDVKKCKNSLELNDFIEKYIAEANSSDDTYSGIYRRVFEEWKRTLKKKPARMS